MTNRYSARDSTAGGGGGGGGVQVWYVATRKPCTRMEICLNRKSEATLNLEMCKLR